MNNPSKESDTCERHNLPDLKEKFSNYHNKSGSLGIRISPECAITREGQLLLWMTCNLCLRLKDVIFDLELMIPDNIPISNNDFIPFLNKSSNDLKESILEGTRLCNRGCNIVFTKGPDFDNEKDVVILLGHNTETSVKSKFAIRAVGEGWLSCVGTSDWMPNIQSKNSNNPFGSFIASCLAVGNIYKFLREIKPENGSFISKLSFSAYNFKTNFGNCTEDMILSNPTIPEFLDVGKLYVIGAGAVGNAFCHSLYSIGGIKGKLVIIDRKSNEKGKDESLEETNLNRYLMASSNDVGKLKASHLAQIMNSKSLIQAESFDESFERYVNEGRSTSFEQLISCVDTNSGRHAIQDTLPRIIYGGSTDNMSLRISLYDLSKDTQCLKCYNSIFNNSETDQDIIQRLSKLSDEDRKNEADKKGVEISQLDKFLQDPKCGELGIDSIQKFALVDSNSEWSVGFVSAMSGFLLASEFIKLRLKNIIDCNMISLDSEPYTDFFFNFWNDDGRLGVTKSKNTCWCNQDTTTPRDVFNSIWK